MTVQAFVVTPARRAAALDVLGVQITVLAANRATGGYEITLQQGTEGAGPPPHSHAWDESFYVLGGAVEIACAGRSVDCTPGTLVHVPAGTVHGFRFAAGGGQMLEISGPGGRATEMFASVARQIPPEVPDVARLIEVLLQNGVSVAAG